MSLNQSFISVFSESEKLPGSLPGLSAHSFASNWQLPFLNQRKGDNGRRFFFMTMQISTKECAGREDRTRNHLLTRR